MLGVSKQDFHHQRPFRVPVLISLYVKYSDLQNESQGESRKRVAGESLPDDFLKKSRPEQKPSEPKANQKNNQGGKTAGRYFESP